MDWFRKTIFSKRFWLGQKKYDNSDSKLTVTVVIPAWNEEDFIADTIRSVLNSDISLKVIVVNDSSTDDTETIAKKYEQVHTDRFPELSSVKVITTPNSQGSKSQALNYAIDMVDTDIFICIDADTVVEPDAIRKILKAFNNDNVYVASGFVKSKGSSNFWQCSRKGEYIVGQSIIKSAQENLNAVLVAAGCFFAIRTKFLKEHRFKDDSMAEDMDLTWEALENGYDVAFVPEAICTVSDPENFKVFDKQVSRWFCGFFQCIKKRNFNLFSKNIKLGIFAYAYLIFNFLGTPFFLINSLITIWISPAGFVIILLGLYLIILVPALIHGIIAKDKIINYPYYVICMILAAPVNYYIYVRSGYNELFTENKLTTWVKGH